MASATASTSPTCSTEQVTGERFQTPSSSLTNLTHVEESTVHFSGRHVLPPEKLLKLCYNFFGGVAKQAAETAQVHCVINESGVTESVPASILTSHGLSMRLVCMLTCCLWHQGGEGAWCHSIRAVRFSPSRLCRSVTALGKQHQCANPYTSYVLQTNNALGCPQHRLGIRHVKMAYPKHI